jgi:hypothetical protein
MIRERTSETEPLLWPTFFTHRTVASPAWARRVSQAGLEASDAPAEALEAFLVANASVPASLRVLPGGIEGSGRPRASRGCVTVVVGREDKVRSVDEVPTTQRIEGGDARPAERNPRRGPAPGWPS